MMKSKILWITCILASCVMAGGVAFAQDSGDEMAPSSDKASQTTAGNDGNGGDAGVLGKLSAVKSGGKIARIDGRSVGKSELKQTNANQRYTVEIGDTLWDLSQRFWGDSAMWPALWALNPQVTNPHWIYPGDTLKFAEDNPMSETVNPDPGFKQKIRISGKRRFILPAFYSSKEPKHIGHILFSDAETRLLKTNDHVQVDWVDTKDRQFFQPGQRFGVFQVSEPILNEDGDEIARKWSLVGRVELVKSDQKRLKTAIVTDVYREFGRGSVIYPIENVFATLTKVRNATNLEGRIIDTDEGISQVGSQQFVIINRGVKDGVVNGNRFHVFEQKEGLNLLEQGQGTESAYANYRETDDRNFEKKEVWPLGRPPESPLYPEYELAEAYEDRDYTTDDLPLKKIGEIAVIHTDEKFSTGVVVQSLKELKVNQNVVLVEGF